MTISFLHGESGTGKTYIVQRVMENSCLRDRLVFYQNFSEDHLENAKNILHLVYFAIFPYLAPQDIDPEYLAQFDETVGISSWLVHLSHFQEQPSKLDQELQAYCNAKGTIFPNRHEQNPRFLFLDNIQNLNKTAQDFLFLLLREARAKQYPFFILFSGQSHLLESDFYYRICQFHSVHEYECALTEEDVILNIKAHTSFDMDRYSNMLGDYFPNIIILISFLKYAQAHPNEELNSLDSFLLLYSSFVNGNMGENLVLERFSNTLADPQLNALCKAVYTAPNGVLATPEDSKAAQALLQCGLVKLDQRNWLVPFHDIYEGIFRRTYQISKRDLNIAYVSELDEIRDRVLFPSTPNDVALFANRITELRKEGKFRSVDYISVGFVITIVGVDNSPKRLINPQRLLSETKTT